MPDPQPASVVHLTRRVRKLFKRLLRCQQLPRCLVWRIQIVLQVAKGRSNSRIARRLGLDRGTVRLWRGRWAAAQTQLETALLEGATRQPLIEHLLRVNMMRRRIYGRHGEQVILPQHAQHRLGRLIAMLGKLRSELRQDRAVNRPGFDMTMEPLIVNNVIRFGADVAGRHRRTFLGDD